MGGQQFSFDSSVLTFDAALRVLTGVLREARVKAMEWTTNARKEIVFFVNGSKVRRNYVV